VPSREAVADYASLKDEIDRQIGGLCGRFATPGWTPVRYLLGSLAHADLAALYRMADVALVTPLCDGMNLVCKEYCAAQVDQVGTLVLGERAGAAEQLGPAGAILVSPRDAAATADAIHRALVMHVGERRARMASMRAAVAEEDVFGWAESFLCELERTRVPGGAPDAEAAAALRWRVRRPLGTPVGGYPAQREPALGAETGERRWTTRSGEANEDVGGARRSRARPAAAR
jgi:trehalose 6-phosphate synthase